MTQNKLAFILALILSGMIMVMFLPALTEARELTLIDHINSVRSKPLKEDKFLTNLAAERCRTMKEWSHQQFYSYANEIMYTYSWRGIKTRNKYAAENLANGYANDKDAFIALQNSPSHKANNESELYQKAGVSKCWNKVGLVHVILFSGN
jgi:uncharacterized protein YkwD